jgi:hypothetical protein
MVANGFGHKFEDGQKISSGITVSGMVYDTATGLLETVAEPMYPGGSSGSDRSQRAVRRFGPTNDHAAVV